MKFSEKLKKALGSAIFWYVAIVQFGLTLLFLFNPKIPALTMVLVGIFVLAILVLIIASGFKTDEQITSKSIPGGGIPEPDGDDNDGNG